MYFGKLVFESDEQEFSLRGVKSKKISSHPGRDPLKSVTKVRNARVKVEWMKREEQLSIICVKVVLEGEGRDKSRFVGLIREMPLMNQYGSLGHTICHLDYCNVPSLWGRENENRPLRECNTKI